MGSIEDGLVAVAKQFLEEELCLRRGEKLLIYVDSDATEEMIDAVRVASSLNGVTCTVGQLPNGVAHSEKERALEDLVERETFDVLCEASDAYFYPSVAWERARAKGAGIYAIGALEADAFLRCFGSINRKAMSNFGNRMREILDQAGTIEMTARNGTRITMQMKVGAIKRVWLKLTRRLTQSLISVPTGNMQRGRYTFLFGQISFLGVPASIEGVAMIDDYIWPPPDLGTLTSNVVLHINGGRVSKMGGSGREANILRDWLKGRTTDLKHFCIGFNPGAWLRGTLIEAERVFGALTIGMGEYPFHVDAIITCPTITIDGNPMEKEGVFVDEILAELQSRLVAPPSQFINEQQLS